jgi:zinc transporter 1
MIKGEADANLMVLESEINWVLITAGIGLAINLFGLLLFCRGGGGHSHHGHSHSHSHINADLEQTDPILEDSERHANYNNHAVILHIIGDSLGSVVVIGSSLVIKYVPYSWKFYFDPLGSALIVIVIVISSIKLLKKCISVLLHKIPKSITTNYAEMLDRIRHIAEVSDIHEFHIWPLNNMIIIASIHIKLRTLSNSSDNTPARTADTIIGEIKGIFHEYGIHSSTVQPEWEELCSEPICRTNCNTYQCCQIEELV